VARSETILGWYRKLVARKFEGSKARKGLGRPRITREVEQLIVRMAEEIVGALANLGYKVSDQTIGNILQRHGLPPRHLSASVRPHGQLSFAATRRCWRNDFFTAQVLTLRGLQRMRQYRRHVFVPHIEQDLKDDGREAHGKSLRKTGLGLLSRTHTATLRPAVLLSLAYRRTSSVPMLSVDPEWYRRHRCGADGPIHPASPWWSRATNASRMARVAESFVTFHASGPSLNFDCVAGVGSVA
jgi:hypothetical protein